MRVRRDSTEAQRRASRAACAARWARTWSERAGRKSAILAHAIAGGNYSETARAFGIHNSYVCTLVKLVGLAPVDERGERETG